MVTKVLLLLPLLCLHHLHAFVLHNNKRDHTPNAGANKLAEALRVIQTQKRKISEKEDAERLRGYYGDTLGWQSPQARIPYGGLAPLEEFGGEEEANPLYEDYDQLGPDALKLLEYYYDLGQRSGEPQLELPVADNDDVTEVDRQEIQNLLDTTKEKKNIDWTPKALGFEGLKHKRGGVSQKDEKEAVDDVTGGTANENEGEEESDNDQSPVKASQLTDDEVNELLSNIQDNEVKSVAKEVNIEEINGQKTVSEKEITDILKDTDGDGKKEEIVLEKEVPPTKVKDINKELVMGPELMNTGLGSSMKQKRGAGSFLDEVTSDYLAGGGADYVPTEQDLLRECLVKYIELEDQENTALAEALNWATKAQYDQTDAYIPMQVEYLRKAVTNEASLADIRRQCFELATQVDEEENELDDELEEPDQEGFPLMEDSDDVIDDEPIIGEGGFLPQGQSESLDDLDEDEPMPSKRRLSKEELANYITSELMALFSRKGNAAAAEEDEDDGEWMGNAVDDLPEDDDDDQVAEWQLNPFLRELILRYKEDQLNMDKRGGEEEDLEDDYSDYEQPEDSAITDLVTPYNLEEEDSDLYDLESCPAVEQLSDNCAYAEALGWALDEEAVELCNRHLMCYLCGSEHHLSPSVCDKGYLGEAYTSCEVQSNPRQCMEQADLLFELMFKTHPYSPEVGARYSCKAQCTLDYITGGSWAAMRRK